ncbi:MAG: ParA family protein (plasmid) [Spiroplasma endosymbiont of Drosophila atripex]|nr:MAG: ParA family protein [Spiroplasma endosymbiont of Drosophila atripex]
MGKETKKMKMISFCNKKGGVGKTTLCKNIAYKLALENKKVLVIDLDSQGTITLELQKDNTDIKKTMAKIIASVEDISIDKIIQKSKYKNIDIIASSENVRKSIFLIKDLYEEKEKYLIGDLIYKINKNIFDNYDYVLIDYPPTVDELSLNYLLISDLILIPINSGIGSYKGIVDLQNTLNYITNIDKRDMPVIKLVFNNIKDNENTSNILDWLKEKKYSNYLVNTNIKHSDTFIKTENDLSSIWDSQYYWRQKQAYEELIKEII